MSSIASSPGAPLQRFAEGFRRFAAVVSAIGLLVAIGMSLPSSWIHLGGADHPATKPTYTSMTPADPVRVSIAGLNGLQVVAPLVRATDDPRQALLQPPDDAPLVSWWSGSAQAGAKHGQTILLAHAAGAGGGLSQIAELGKGDLVDLLTSQGTMRYQVDSIRTFDPSELGRVDIQLFKQDGGAGRLVMLSAEAWDGATYQRNVVVTALPLGQPAS